ncbi:hypothetical protein ACOMHN_028449 [Nucella lapillus]
MLCRCNATCASVCMRTDTGATQTSSNADDRAVERGPAEGTPRYWLRKRKHNPSSERQPRGKRARKSALWIMTPVSVANPVVCFSSVDYDTNCQWLILWSVFSFDPLLLPDVVDNILEFLDEDTLLTGRLVSRLWKHEITQRNGLWRRKFERLGAHKPEKTFVPEKDFFSVHMNFKSMLGQMSRGEGWRADTCDASQCLLHEGLAKYNERERREDWVLNIVSDFKHKERVEKKIILITRHGELVVLDEEKKKVAWRTERNVTNFFTLFRDSIFTITFLGNIEVYTLNGKCAVTDTGGKLQGVRNVHVNPTGCFLLVLLRNRSMFLLNVKMQVFPLRLPSPPLPRQRDGRESAEWIMSLEFDLVVNHTDRQLAVAVRRQSSLSLVTFTRTGDVLHRLFLKCHRLNEFTPALDAGRGRYKLVCLWEGHVVARSVYFSSRGIAVEQLWKSTIPARFLPALHRHMILAGRKFLLSCDDSTFQVYRMDDGTLVADFSAFLNGYKLGKSFIMKTRPCATSIDTTVQDVHRLEAHNRPDMVYIINFDWLDGLSPSTMRPDFPVAILFTKEIPGGRCLRWSQALWMSEEEPVELEDPGQQQSMVSWTEKELQIPSERKE